MTKKFTIDTIKVSEANRDISRNHVDRLKGIIKEKGYLKGCPILVDEDGLIIDGQHRYLACKELGIEPEIVCSGNFDIVPILNSTQMKWCLRDYVKYYATKDYEDYIILERICKNKGISPNIAYNIIFGKNTTRDALSRKGGSQSPLKNGTFKLPDKTDKGLAKLDRKIDRILALISALNLPRTDRLIIAIARIAKDSNFNFDKMLGKIEYQKARIYRCSTITEYMQMLANIYNHKNSKKIAV